MESEPKAKPHWPKCAIVSGSLLMLATTALAAGWFYFLAPMCHRADPRWMADHTAFAQWNEEQRTYRRLGTSPDLMFRPDKIHFYGNKAWFKWLLDRVNAGTSDFRVCGCTFSCLSYMSNHDFDSERDWSRWYAANKNKTQEEWLLSGFAERKVEIALPPSALNTEALLSLVGKLSEGPPRPGYRLQDNFDAPGYIRYNAFRWLRDMGFDPASYLINHQAAKLPPEIISGVRQYWVLERRFPSSSGVGILAFGKQTSNPLDEFPPRISPATIIPFIVYGIMLALGTPGILLFRRGLRTLHLRSTPASPTSHPPSTADAPTDR